jgi:hypothetical protein
LSGTYVRHPKFKIGQLLLACSLVLWSCSKKLDAPVAGTGPARLRNGSWTPSLSNAGSANHKGSVTITKTEMRYSGIPMVRLNEGWSGKEVTINLGTYTTADFGPNGSMSLVAEVLNYPTTGGAYAVLTSFSVFDGSTTTEYIALNSTCATSGMYTCTGGSCAANGCDVTSGSSAFAGRDDWDQHQIPPFGYITTNTFPRCDPSANSWSSCPTGYGTMKAGTYTAKFALLSDSGSSMAGKLADLKVTKIIKKDGASRGLASATNGALSLNVILVGDENINDSHTPKGAQNLNLLYQEVGKILKEGAGVGLGEVHVFEWPNNDGGSQWESPDYSDLGTMFAAGSAGINLIDSSLEGSSVNVFMVRDIGNGGGYGTILGLSGGILGPYTNGTETSGLAFSTYIGGVSNPSIAGFNPGCSLSTCPRTIQEDGFLEMGATIAHEIGHYIGLNHPSERPRVGYTQSHDQLSDTPKAAGRLVSGSYSFDQLAVYNDSTNTFSGQSCATACDAAIGGGQKYFNTGNTDPYHPNNYCPAVEHCQFNHLMWWSTKNRKYTAGVLNGEDGNLISTQSSAIVQWNPFIK